MFERGKSNTFWEDLRSWNTQSSRGLNSTAWPATVTTISGRRTRQDPPRPPGRWLKLVTDYLRRLVEKHWPWPQPKLGKPAPPINRSGPPALSGSEAKAFAEGVETAQDA